MWGWYNKWLPVHKPAFFPSAPQTGWVTQFMLGTMKGEEFDALIGINANELIKHPANILWQLLSLVHNMDASSCVAMRRGIFDTKTISAINL